MFLQWRYYQTVQLKKLEIVCIAISILMPPHNHYTDTELGNIEYRFYIGKKLLLRGYWKFVLCANASKLYKQLEYIFQKI